MREALNLVIKITRRYTLKLVLGCILLLLCSILILPTPLLTRHIVDIVLPSKNFHSLFLMVSILFFLLVLQKGLEYIQGIIFISINSRIMIDIRTSLLNHVIRASTVNGMEPGYLLPRINDDTNRLNSLFADSFVDIIRNLLTLATGLVAMIVLDPKLAVVVVILLPIFALMVKKYSASIRLAAREAYEREARTSSNLLECLSFRDLFRSYSRENYGVERYKNIASRSLTAAIHSMTLQKQSSLLAGLLAGLCPVIVLIFGGWQIMQGSLTLGTFIAFSNFTGYLFGPTMKLVSVNSDIAQTRAALERIGELLNFECESKPPFEGIDGNIQTLELRDVSYVYKRGDGIRNVSFRAQRGMKIGIVGHSGAGKTTLSKILSGLVDPSGDLIINGDVLSKSGRIALREKVGLVEQEPRLLDCTISENITLGDPQFTAEEISEALIKANAADFVSRLPQGELTPVGDLGNSLSAGQRQRIAIARALIRRPDILILDEGTSSLDHESERAISAAVDKLSEDLIAIVIAHRLETIRNSDFIIVIEGGAVVATGSHRDLLANSTYYARQAGDAIN